MNNFDPKVMMEAKAKVMITCFLWGMVFLLVWLLVYLFLGDWAYSIHSKMFRKRNDFKEVLCTSELLLDKVA